MKKPYQKPLVHYEDFGLAQSVSSQCEGIANFEQNDCSVTIPELGFNIFNSSICEVSGPGVDDMICYFAPYDWNNVFSS